MAYDPQLDPDDVEAQRRQSEEFRNRPENKAKLAELEERLRAESKEPFPKMQKEAERAKSMWDKFRERHGIIRGGGGGSGSAIDIEGLPAKLRPRGGKQMKKGGKVKSASARADGCAKRGKTKGKIL